MTRFSRTIREWGWLVLVAVALLAMSACGSGGSASPTDGDGPDGDTEDGDEPDGDGPDGDTGDGDEGDGDEEDGDGEDGDTVDGDEPTQQVELSDGRYTVSLDAEERTLTLSAPGRGELVRFVPDSLVFGLVNEVKDETNYDPSPMVAKDPIYNPPAGMQWVHPLSMQIESASASVVRVAVTYPEELEASFVVEVLEEGNFRCELTPLTQLNRVAYYRVRAYVDETEGLYGLGEQLDDVNNRGKIRPMQITFDLTIDSGYNEVHVPIPFVTGSRGWGLFTECPYPGVFEVALGNEEVGDNVVQATFGPGSYAGEGFVIHLFADEHPLDIPRHYYDVTGYPGLPARWALGPWIWRDEIDGRNLPHYGQELIEYDLQIIRDLDLACTGYWIDRPYAHAVNTFDWDNKFFTDAQAVVDMAHDLGYRVAIWQAPYIDSSSEWTVDILQEATDAGYFPPASGILANPWGNLIDFTNPDAYAWWQEKMRFYTDMGIEGFKLDYAEDVIPGLYGARNVWTFHDGSDERTMHHFYQNLYHQVHAELLPEDGGFLLCRAGAYGDQVHGCIIWPGDLNTNMSRHRERIPGECKDKGCVGGMPASMVAGLSLSMSGYPFFGADTGGYLHKSPDKETFMRWMVQTALSSVMQVGTGENDVPWEFREQNGFDEELLDAYREFARLHLRLWPYAWSYVKQIPVTGRPIQRPFGVQVPHLDDHRWDQYFFGDDLLVAPVVEAAVLERDVYFPEGRWINWFSGEIHEGLGTYTEAAPPGTLPLYLREGGIVPLLRPTISTLAPVAEAHRDAVDSYATTPGLLYPVIFPGAASSFELFDGSRIGQEETAGGLTLTSSDGSEFAFGVVFSVVGFGDSAPASVHNGNDALAQVADEQALDAAQSGWLYLPERGGLLLVKVGAGENTVYVTR